MSAQGGAVGPPLFFKDYDFDEKAGVRAKHAQEYETCVLEAQSQLFVVRTLGPYIVFRPHAQTFANEAEAFFLMRGKCAKGFYENIRSARMTATAFAAQLGRGEFGRCFLYRSGEMRSDECAFLLISPNGMGEALVDSEIVPFLWNQSGAKGKQAPEAELHNITTPLLISILSRPSLDTSIDAGQRKAFCEAMFRNRINPHLSNPFVSRREFEKVRFVFNFGSREELHRVTIAACHVEPSLYEGQADKIMVSYWGKSLERLMHRVRVSRAEKTYLGPCLQELCEIAVRHNTFTGLEFDDRWQPGNRRSHLQGPGWRLNVRAHLPSAHEQAESLLFLYDWLDGKVSDKERRRLLRLTRTQK